MPLVDELLVEIPAFEVAVGVGVDEVADFGFVEVVGVAGATG